MITGTVWGITMIAVGLVAALAATHVLLAALFPRRIATTRTALRTRPVVSALVGAAVVAVALGILRGLSVAAPPAVGPVAVAALLATLLGWTAVAAEVGARLRADDRSLLRGSVTVSLASLLPVFGWFLVAPVAVAAGVGAFAIGLVRPAPDATTPHAARTQVPAEASV